MAKFQRRFLFLLVPIFAVGFVSYESSRFLLYDQLLTLLSSTSTVGSMEYVTMPHPNFDCISYRLGARVMSVKLSDCATERYVLVPEKEVSSLLEKIEKLNVPIVAID
jgi:hypothetical protein